MYNLRAANNFFHDQVFPVLRIAEKLQGFKKIFSNLNWLQFCILSFKKAISFATIAKPDKIYRWFSCRFRFVYAKLFPIIKRVSSDGCKCWLLQCRDEFRQFNAFQMKHFHLKLIM